MKVQSGLDKLLSSRTVQILTIECLYLEDFSLILKKRSLTVWRKWNKNSVFTAEKTFSPSFMATLRNKRKLASVSIETPESTRSGRTQNILDPELTQDYISQVSEEIEGRVIKKLSKEFSRTESRILGALSKLDEFLLNPQVRTCSIAVPGITRSSNLENQGTNEDRPSGDPGPEVEFSSPHFVAETDPHIVTGATDPHIVTRATDRHMVTGVTRKIRQHPHITMETHE